MKSLQQIGGVLLVAAIIGFTAPMAFSIVTSDGFGTHVIDDGTSLDLDGILWFDTPTLNHDSVAQLRFFRPDHGDTFCSSSLINTPIGAGTLTAAHCLVDNQGQMISSDFRIVYYDSGTPTEFTTDNPNNVFVHPNYDGTGWHGYDLAMVFWDQSTLFVSPKYDVFDGPEPPLYQPIIKMGFGRTGHGDGVDPTILDELKRWGLNRWESFALGDFGVPVPGGWDNTETQFSMDFDSGLVENDVFSFYFYDGIPKTYYLGFGPDEVVGASGDSGGPNFVYDGIKDEWVVGGVSSYVFRIPDEFGPPGNTDVNGVFDFSWGEYEGDAQVNADLVDQLLGLAAPPESTSAPFGHGKGQGGHLTPWQGQGSRR